MRRRAAVLWFGLSLVFAGAGCSGQPGTPSGALPPVTAPRDRDAAQSRDVPSPTAAEVDDLEPAAGMEIETGQIGTATPDAQGISQEHCSEILCGNTGPTSVESLRPDRDPTPQGALLMAGGGLRLDNADVWSKFVDLAADYARKSGEPEGTRPRIAVFPTAAFYPQQAGDRIVAALQKYGADAFVVPIAIKNHPIDVRQAVADPRIVSQIESAHGVFFSGGQQARITEALRTAEGRETAALEAIWHVYNAGGVVGGSSAGTAVMSRIMCRAVDSQLAVLEKGVTPGRETTEGLGFLDRNWFVDQHFIIRGRFARALAVTQHHGLRHGLGVDENTALLVHHGEAEIIGYRGAIFLDLSEARHDPQCEGFNVRNARLSYLDRGDHLNMATLVLTPSIEKQAEPVIDPNSPTFEPDNDEPIFTTDILGNSTVLDVMRQLMNNRRSHATGLAFDGSAAERGPVPAFEFRLYREKDTRAWPPGAGEDYTIANVHLDVRRVEIERLSYR
jgi:cyanophycinase